MLGIPTPLPAAIAAGVLLLASAGSAIAQSATTTTIATTTTTTTSTTLLPHPFSAATRSCVRAAKRALRACGHGATCRTDYETTYSKCFASGSGVTCAKRCVGRETTCITSLPTTKKTCRKACVTSRKADVLACRRIANGDTLWAGGDASCLTTAQGTFDLCRAVCADSIVDCRNAIKFCVANCANL